MDKVNRTFAILNTWDITRSEMVLQLVLFVSFNLLKLVPLVWIS
jgi:hypothetical protein